MRIYNGTKSQLGIPLSNLVKLTIGPNSVSQDFLPNETFMNTIAASFTDKQIALVVSGPFAFNFCAKFPSLTPMIAQSLDEAIKRFYPALNKNKSDEKVVKEPVKNDTVEAPKSTPKPEEPKAEEPKEEVEEEEVVEVGINEMIESLDPEIVGDSLDEPKKRVKRVAKKTEE